METQKILDLVADCYKRLAEHVFQSEVNSAHLRRVKDNLAEIEKLCKKQDRVPNGCLSRRGTRAIIKNKSSLLKIAYAMSRFDYPIIQKITGLKCNQTESFDYLAKKTGVKAATIRNMRDQFDPYVVQERSNRKGWYKLELPEEYKKIKEIYDKKSENEIACEISEIIKNIKLR
ncbi:MAG: hypothetical protein D6732_20390 [Methanobacteriota archaeon]|nr:MAG: hypothetical protein D6732_20390 [Euryarchaeota archaeon]